MTFKPGGGAGVGAGTSADADADAGGGGAVSAFLVSSSPLGTASPGGGAGLAIAEGAAGAAGGTGAAAAAGAGIGAGGGSAPGAGGGNASPAPACAAFFFARSSLRLRSFSALRRFFSSFETIARSRFALLDQSRSCKSRLRPSAASHNLGEAPSHSSGINIVERNGVKVTGAVLLDRRGFRLEFGSARSFNFIQNIALCDLGSWDERREQFYRERREETNSNKLSNFPDLRSSESS